MPRNADIRQNRDISRISAHLELMTKKLEELNAMPIGSPGTFKTNTTNATIYWDDFEDEERFDPEHVDWEQLIELYRDDPVLTVIFGQLEEYFAKQVPGFRPSAGTLRWGDDSGATSLSPNAVGSGTSTTGLYLYGSTTDVSVSHPVTVTYDANGTVRLKYDEEYDEE